MQTTDPGEPAARIEIKRPMKMLKMPNSITVSVLRTQAEEHNFDASASPIASGYQESLDEEVEADNGHHPRQIDSNSCINLDSTGLSSYTAPNEAEHDGA